MNIVYYITSKEIICWILQINILIIAQNDMPLE